MEETVLLPIASFPTLHASLYRDYAGVPAAGLLLIYAAVLATSISLLTIIEAELWAYSLCAAGLFLHAAITAFHRKYHGVSPQRSQGNGMNRRARRRER